MKQAAHIVILSLLFSCTTTKEYKLYRRDKSINYPAEKLTLMIIDDATGLFINDGKGGETFNQKFSFVKATDKYLIIENVTPTSKDRISLNQGDTIVVHKNQLHFFYKGNEKYLLSFKRRKL